MSWLDVFFLSVLVVKDHGSALPVRPAINLLGSGVAAVDNPGTASTDVTIEGGGGADATVYTYDSDTQQAAIVIEGDTYITIGQNDGYYGVYLRDPTGASRAGLFSDGEGDTGFFAEADDGDGANSSIEVTPRTIDLTSDILLSGPDRHAPVVVSATGTYAIPLVASYDAFGAGWASSSNFHDITVTGALTISTVTGPTGTGGGDVFHMQVSLIFRQDASGHVVTLPANIIGAGAISSTAHHVTVLIGVWDGTNLRIQSTVSTST